MTDYESLKVPELKALLKERSLSQSGRKADLIIRLQTADIDEAGAAEEEAQPQGDAAPAEAQPRDDEQQPLHNGAVDGNDKKSPQAPNEAEVAQSETVPGEAADAKQCSPDKPEEAVQDTEQEPPAAGEVEDKDTAEPPSGVEAPPAESDGHGVDADHSKADHAEAAEAVAAPAEIPATEDDAVQVEPEANDDAPPADSPARGHQTSPPKMAEHNEESDSLSLGDTDSEQNDPKVSVMQIDASLGLDHVMCMCAGLTTSYRFTVVVVALCNAWSINVYDHDKKFVRSHDSPLEIMLLLSSSGS